MPKAASQVDECQGRTCGHLVIGIRREQREYHIDGETLARRRRTLEGDVDRALKEPGCYSDVGEEWWRCIAGVSTPPDDILDAIKDMGIFEERLRDGEGLLGLPVLVRLLARGPRRSFSDDVLPDLPERAAD